MKSHLLCTIGAALLAAGSLLAQGSQAIKVDVPFAFHAGGVNFPAGEYRVDNAGHATIVRVSSADRKYVSMMTSNSTENYKAVGERKLVFNRYGNQYFLSEVWAGSGAGRQLLPTKREKETALAAAIRPAQQTLLATTAAK